MTETELIRELNDGGFTARAETANFTLVVERAGVHQGEVERVEWDFSNRHLVVVLKSL